MQIAWSAELPDAVTDIAWAAGDGGLYAGSANGEIRHYRTDGRVASSWQAHEGGVIRLRLRPDGEVLGSTGEDGRVALWHAQTGDLVSTLADEPVWVEHLEWTPDGAVLAAAAEKTIYLWRGTESLGVWYDARRRVLAMAWAPDSKRLATASNKGLYLWRLGGEEPMQLLEFPGAPVSVAWQGNGGALAAGTQDGFLQIWRQRAQGPARQLTMRGYPGKVACVQWHPSKPVIATAGGRDLVLWQLNAKQNGSKATPLRAHRETVTALAYGADGRWLASGDRAGRLCLWDEAGGLRQTWEQHAEITQLRWSTDGAMLAVGSIDGALQSYAVLTADI